MCLAMKECATSRSVVIAAGRVLVIIALLIIASESRPQEYPDIVLSSTYYNITPETRPLKFHNRELYRPIRNGENATQIKDPSGESKIVFPEPIKPFIPEVSGQQPKCANEEGFCENAEDYPQEHVRQIIQNEAKFYTFGSDYMDVNIRINPEKDMSLCPSMEQLVYPKIAQNKEEKWLYVINQDTYLQGIRIEKCVRQGSCTFSDNFPSGYTTSCQQKYIYRQLLALGEDGRTAPDSFRFPSCCSCVVTKIF